MSDPVEILKYPNRKLYISGRGYVRTFDVAEIVRGGRSVKIVNSESGADETLFVLSSLIHREVSKVGIDPGEVHPHYTPSDLEGIIRRAVVSK